VGSGRTDTQSKIRLRHQSPPEGSPPENRAAAKFKVLVGALLAIILVVGLYYVNRYWIAPASESATGREMRTIPGAGRFR